MKKYLLLLIFISCSFVDEIKHMQPLEIEAYSPDESIVNVNEITSIGIKFSSEMNRISAENAFSLKKNGDLQSGRFLWHDNIMEFIPDSDLSERSEYEVKVLKSAEDEYGNSLDEDFSFSFFTGSEKGEPYIVDCSPSDYETVSDTDLRHEIRIEFSETIDLPSFYENFSISPEINGSFTWSENNSVMLFTPFEDMESGESYKLTISSSLSDLSGNTMIEDFESHFSVEDISEIEIDSLIAQGSGNEIFDSSIQNINSDIEKDESFIISFLAPVPLSKRSGIFSISPSVQYDISWNGTYQEATITLNSNMEWNTVYSITILDNIYYIRVDGVNSLPLEVERVNFASSKAAGTYQELELNATLNPFVASTDACFDFYIRHSENTEIDVYSFYEAISINVSISSDSFDYVSIESSEETTLNPAPNPVIADIPFIENTQITVIRLNCNIVIDAFNSGKITISLDESLKDNQDNFQLNGYEVQVYK